MSQQILAHVEAASLNPNVDPFEIGDTVDVHNRILSFTAKTTRTTMFQHPGNPENDLSFVFIRVSAK